MGSRKRKAAERAPFLCECGADRYEVSHGRAQHAPQCAWKKRSDAYNAGLRARLAKADALATERRAAKAERIKQQESETMSTKTALKLAANDLDSMNMETLRARAATLNVAGRSKLTKKADLIKAIKRAELEAQAAAAESKPKSNGKAKAKSDAKPVDAGKVKVGVKVRMVRSVDLSRRNHGYVGVVEEGTEGVVEELKRVGPGIQVVLKVRGESEPIALGIRHVEVA